MEKGALIEKLEKKKEKLEEQLEETTIILDALNQQTKIGDFE